MMNAEFFEISNACNLENNLDRECGSLFLKYKNTKPIVMILDTITPPDHTPVSNGSGVTGSTPGITTVSDTSKSEGNTTDTKLINTMLIENKNTIHGIMEEFVLVSNFLAFLLFANRIVFDFTCLKYEWN